MYFLLLSTSLIISKVLHSSLDSLSSFQWCSNTWGKTLGKCRSGQAELNRISTNIPKKQSLRSSDRTATAAKCGQEIQFPANISGTNDTGAVVAVSLCCVPLSTLSAPVGHSKHGRHAVQPKWIRRKHWRSFGKESCGSQANPFPVIVGEKQQFWHWHDPALNKKMHLNTAHSDVTAKHSLHIRWM